MNNGRNLLTVLKHIWSYHKKYEYLRYTFIVGLLVFLNTEVCTNAFAVVQISPEKSAWTWFSDPRAIRYGDMSVVGYVRDQRGSVGGQRSAIELAGYRNGQVQKVTLDESKVAPDDHNNPAFVVRSDGRLQVFWSYHPGPYISYRVALNPGSIEDWGPIYRVTPQKSQNSTFISYVNPLLVSGKLNIFYRGLQRAPTVTRSVNGSDFTTGRTVVYTPGNQRPYAKYVSDGKKVFLTFTEGHPSEYNLGNGTRVWFAALAGNNKLFDAHNQLLGSTPLMTTKTQLVYQGKTPAWVHDIAISKEGNPVIVFATFPTVNAHVYNYAIFKAGKWKVSKIVDAGPYISYEPFSTGRIETYYSAGITINKENPSIVYLSRKVGPHYEIERWKTKTNGLTWQSQPVTSSSKVDNVRPFFLPKASSNSKAEINLAWLNGDYANYLEFKTYVVGARVN